MNYQDDIEEQLEATKQALTDALAEVERLKTNRSVLASMLLCAAQPQGSGLWTITLNQQGYDALDEMTS